MAVAVGKLVAALMKALQLRFLPRNQQVLARAQLVDPDIDLAQAPLALPRCSSNAAL